ncbi:hypothetical protein V3O24_03610 [Methylobacter sp. Wu8]|uniref:hypothetical protein n=1 Tax=Methylobacter sp. Wu8 TaxID=3118457 RepID=UPI002F3258A6
MSTEENNLEVEKILENFFLGNDPRNCDEKIMLNKLNKYFGKVKTNNPNLLRSLQNGLEIGYGYSMNDEWLIT